MQNDYFLRQTDLVRPQELEFPITVVGAGGIGSWATIALAKLGCSDLTVIDFDTVEKHNIPNQIFTPDQIGKPKVEALKELVRQLTGAEIQTVEDKFEAWYKPAISRAHVIVVAVDSLDARRMIWSFVQTDQNLRCLIDARMGGELLRMFMVSPGHRPSVMKYIKSLDPTIPESEDPCTARSIVYNTLSSGAMIANMVKKYAKKDTVPLSFDFDFYNAITL